MDSFISSIMHHLQPALVLIAIALSLIAVIMNKDGSAATMNTALGYFILFPITVYAVWQCVSLIFFPHIAAIFLQTVITPYGTQAGLFFLALSLCGVMALLGHKGMTTAVIIITACVCWGAFLASMTGTAVITGSASILQMIVNLTLPAFMIIFNRLGQKEITQTA